MSFNSSPKRAAKNDKSMRLIEESPQEVLNQIQNKFLEFNKDYDDIYAYYNSLPSLSRQEYDRIHNDMHKKIGHMPVILREINELGNNVIQSSADNSMKERIASQLKIINDKLQPKQVELTNLIDDIYDREGKIAKKLSVIHININFQEQSQNGYNTSASSGDERRDSVEALKHEGFRMSRVQMEEIQSNNEYLQKRQVELEEIKKISGQVKDITVMLVGETKKQGEDLKKIDESIVEVKENVLKAEIEIEEAEKETRSSGYCKWIIIASISVAIIIALIIILKIVL